MSNGSGICAACRITRPLDLLIRATMRAGGRTRYVCRPSIADQLPGRPPCFTILRPACEESIELAGEVPRVAEVVRHERAGIHRANVAALAAAGAR